jgi:hypothetical protein
MQFQFRLVGTAIVDFTGRDSTGKWCHDVYQDFETTAAYTRQSSCATDGKPQFCRTPIISNPDRAYIEAERIYLPLAANGKDVDIIIVMTIYLGALTQKCRLANRSRDNHANISSLHQRQVDG